MIIVCSNCTSRIQVDENKMGRPIINCPKCNNDVVVSPQSPASEKSALTVGTSPATERRRYERPNPAPLFQGEGKGAAVSTSDSEKLVQLLSSLIAQKEPLDQVSWDRVSTSRRKVLVCTPEEYRSKLAKSLTQEGYQVFVAGDTKQAVERMRENPLDIVLLESQFDATDQGAAFVFREVNVLRPAQRRRLFFVLLSPSLRTMDAHAAFLNNVNAVVNVKDLDDLAKVLSHALREYNELYRDFNGAFNLVGI
jgi:CheY-like chemotaxis protein/DNA-directed RNA polymerase subunit RPC12/RpoP